MSNRYIPEGSPIKGTITLEAGDVSGKELKVQLRRKRTAAGAVSRMLETKPAEQLGDSHPKVEYEFTKTDGILTQSERVCEVLVWLLVDNHRVKHTKERIHVYRPNLEIHAQDPAGGLIEVAECKLAVGVDPDFDAAGVRYSAPSRVVAGEKIWTEDTDETGVAHFDSLPVGVATGNWSQPYALSDRGWLTEGEFTPNGPKRKAELWKTPTVHYIWWGNPTTAAYIADATDTPNAMAALDVNVMYWCEPTFTAALGPKVNKKVINQPSDLLLGLGTFGDRKQHLDAIVNTLVQYRALSAVKDLISLCVLFSQGGYYFDTTTKIIGTRTQIFQKLVPQADIRIVRTASGGGYNFRSNDRSADGTTASQVESPGTNGTVASKNLDVWALYVPQRNDHVAVMIESYLERAMNFGLHTHPSDPKAGFWAPSTTHEVMTEADKSRRNELIGKLIMTSVQDALWQKTSGRVESLAWTTAFASDAEQTNYHVSAVCADLGIGKRHAGNWRQG